ncbi:MAG: trypsin-like peptidase domain-containing protein [Thermoguttaceae bacterium]|nr:trypsin-like peptidase domain-containing protein [Thermoguttaceae bacterium]
MVLLLVALDGSLAFAQAVESRVHPAVVRVVVQDKSGRSHGSGALVAVTDSFGLVLTNWHVVRDAAAPPVVIFPDGFQSAATIARIDRDWDLAALVIWRPRADPIPLAATPPRPGEPLAIAGYGKGQYRVDTGRCTQFLSPGKHHPFELVELTASARQGDSGGPILNTRGELAGVLFGSAFGRTTGSHSGRVRQFLAPLWNDFYQLPSHTGSMIAGNAQANPPVASIHGVRPIREAEGTSPRPGPPTVSAERSPGGVAVAAVPGQPPGQHSRPAQPPLPANESGIGAPAGAWHPPAGGVSEPWVAATPATPPQDENNTPPPPSRSEQLKTILAAIGILALVFHGVRLLGRAVEV